MKHNLYWTLAGIAFLLLLWELGSRVYGSEIILPGPLPVLLRLIELVSTPRFLLALRSSFLRVISGIIIAVPLAIAIGIIAGLDKRVHAFLKPFFSVVSATPVIALILIAFLILGSGRTPVFTAFLMIFPVMSANVIEGVKSTDHRLKELFIVYRMSRVETLRYLYLPSLTPFIIGGLISSLSLCWKVVVASEVIVQPMRSLGLGMQNARANLEVPELFAWTIATVIAAASSQAFLTLILRMRRKRHI